MDTRHTPHDTPPQTKTDYVLISRNFKSLLQTVPFEFCFRRNTDPLVFLVLLRGVVKVEFGFKLGAVYNLPQVTLAV